MKRGNNVEKLTEVVEFKEKNGICLHMSFFFCNFVADFACAYREARMHTHK